MELLPELILKYFLWFPKLCDRLWEADNGMQTHFCIPIFMDDSDNSYIFHAPNRLSYYGNHPHRCAYVRFLLAFPVHLLLGYNNLLSRVSCSYSRLSNRSPAASVASEYRIPDSISQ